MIDCALWYHQSKCLEHQKEFKMATLINKTTTTQCAAILAYMQTGNSITTPIARALCKCERLAARISDLRNKGYDIETTMHYIDGVKFASYFLASPLPMPLKYALSHTLSSGDVYQKACSVISKIEKDKLHFCGYFSLIQFFGYGIFYFCPLQKFGFASLYFAIQRNEDFENELLRQGVVIVNETKITPECVVSAINQYHS